MTDHPLHEKGAKNGNAFPLMIALTALVLAVTSGVVNYRQNNLANLESSLRDTRDQLQLAKNDITDIKMKTIKQLVDADFAVKNQQHVKHENQQLRDDLADARARVTELEAQIRSMDRKLVSAISRLKANSKLASAKKAASAKAHAKTTSTPASLDSLIATSDLDVYVQRIARPLQQDIGATLSQRGFKPKFPVRPAGMGLSRTTTVFYYQARYKPVANKLVKILSDITKDDVLLKKGASPYPGNKIIVHIIGN